MYSLDDLGWAPFFAEQLTEDELAAWTPARVTSATREHYQLTSGLHSWRTRLPGRIRHAAQSAADLPVVGDWVLASPSDEAATIHRVLDRRSWISRGSAGRAAKAQMIAANVDTALVMTSCNRDLNPRRIERYLALVWEGGATPIVVLTKSDLCADADAWRAQLASTAPGVPVFVVSARRGDGLEAIDNLIRSSGTTVLLGSSGVGKSTLLNALIGENRQKVLPIRETDSRGRHATTSRELCCLRGGGILIDTPGMRELQLWDAAEGLEQTFADVEWLASTCRFRDCSHLSEPGCAVLASVEDGSLSSARLESYHRLRREDEFIRARDDEQARQTRTRHAKKISKALRLQEKLRRR